MVHYSSKTKGKAFGRYELRVGDREKLEILAEIKGKTVPEVVGEWISQLIDANEPIIEKYQAHKNELSEMMARELAKYKDKNL